MKSPLFIDITWKLHILILRKFSSNNINFNLVTNKKRLHLNSNKEFQFSFSWIDILNHFIGILLIGNSLASTVYNFSNTFILFWIIEFQSFRIKSWIKRIWCQVEWKNPKSLFFLIVVHLSIAVQSLMKRN